MPTFLMLIAFGVILVVLTCMAIWPYIVKLYNEIFGDVFKSQPSAKTESKDEDIKDAEFKDVEATVETEVPKDKPAEETESKVPGSYERVELHLSSGVDYIEYHYMDDQDRPAPRDKATKCKIRECDANGNVLRELWGKPYKNDIYEHMKDVFKRN